MVSNTNTLCQLLILWDLEYFKCLISDEANSVAGYQGKNVVYYHI